MNAHRLAAVARLEFRTTLGRPLWWVLLLGACFAVVSLSSTAFLPSGDGSFGGVRPFINSHYALTSFFGLSGFVTYSFFAAVIAGLAVIRDDEHRVSELIHSTALTPTEYVWGKLAGVLGALTLVLLIQSILLVSFYELAGGGGGAGGPFDFRNYLGPALAFGLPPILIFAGLAFAVGEWTRRPMVVFAIPVGLVFALPFFVTWSPPWLGEGLNTALKIADPSGMRWMVQDVIGSATGVDYVNTTRVDADWVFWTNRIALVGAALLSVVLTIPHVRAVIARGGGAERGGRSSDATTVDESSRGMATPSPSAAPLRELGMGGEPLPFAATVLHSLRAEVRELFSQPALYLFVPIVIGAALDVGSSAYGPFGDALILTGGGTAVGLLGMLTFLLCGVLLFFTVESIHRERVSRFDSILYALPVRTGAVLAAKQLASAVLVAALIGVAGVVVIGQIALQGVGRIGALDVLTVWGLVLVPTLVVWSAFVAATMAIVRDRYTTYALGIGALILTLRSLQSPDLEWALNWTALSTLRWSDMGFFALNRSTLLWNRALVLTVSVLLFVVMTRAFARVAPDQTAQVHRLRPANIGGLVVRLLPFAFLPVLLGGVLAVQVRSGFQSDRVAAIDKEYWRRNVATWGDRSVPSLAHVDVTLTVEPAERTLDVAGEHTLVNTAAQVWTELPLTLRNVFGQPAWTIDGVRATAEDRAGLHLIELPNPLQPGDTVRVGYNYTTLYPEGATRNGGGVAQFVLPTGVLLHTLRDSFLPVPGFVQGIGVTSDNYADPAPAAPDFWTREQRPASGPYTARVVIDAPSAYTMNSVGQRTDVREAEGRTTVTWESDHPVGAINVVGGRWDVAEEGTTAVYHHPDHAVNAEVILEALVASRRHYSEWFYPYPWRELRISEYPNESTNAMGFPTNIHFSEGLGFLSMPGAEVPTPWVVTGHEAAHQWWGNILSAGEGPGTAHLVEGMATYASMLLIEEELGAAARMEFARQMEQDYVSQRDTDTERALAFMTGDRGPSDRSIVFNKGAWVQWMLQEHLGREVALGGLRAFIDHYVRDGSRPTLQDLLAFLRPSAEDPQAYDVFVDQWFFDVVVPEFRLTDAEVVQDGDEWLVRTTLAHVGTGLVELEVAARGEKRTDATAGARPRVVTSVRMAPGEVLRIGLRTPFLPTEVVADPDVKLLLRDRDGAVVKIRP